MAGAVVEMLPDVRQYRFARWLIEFATPYLRVFRRNIRPLTIGRMSFDVSWVIGAAVYLVIEAGVDTTLAQLLGKY
ncbi:YggT family protein [Alicyclobacillus sacchari]|uniref:YggT family protein n=1 Tax=Alicyclobacillus sacchari TaxID=392010 RepID=UPI0024E0B098|nr:YggT family protein [Alicyclobacillus sacchari]